jgi:hypothetical protein
MWVVEPFGEGRSCDDKRLARYPGPAVENVFLLSRSTAFRCVSLIRKHTSKLHYFILRPNIYDDLIASMVE